jgi:tetratricopeptide (TPR) repeat protein
LRTYLAVYLSLLGRFPEALQQSEEAIRIAEEAAQPYSRIYAHVGAGQVYLNQGDIPRAVLLLERGVQLGVA